MAELEREKMGFYHNTPKLLLDHLQFVGGSIDYMNVMELTANLDLYLIWSTYHEHENVWCVGSKPNTMSLEGFSVSETTLQPKLSCTANEGEVCDPNIPMSMQSLQPRAMRLSKRNIGIGEQYNETYIRDGEILTQDD